MSRQLYKPPLNYTVSFKVQCSQQLAWLLPRDVLQYA